MAKSSKNNMQQLKVALPYGAITEIARRSSVSYETALRVFSGKSSNRKVLAELPKYIKEIKDAEKKLYTSLVNALK